MGKGLRQGDQLSHFLFVLVADGLAGLVKKVANIGIYKVINIKGKCKVEVL